MKTVLITGASRGIGAQIARSFAASGYGVVINYNNSESAANCLLNEIKEKGGNACVIKADISCEIQVKEMFKRAKSFFNKGVDVLINNAATALSGLFTEVDVTSYRKMFDVNVTGAMICAKEALPYMISKKDGCIINISSVWGITGASCEVHYSAAKAAVIGFTKALAKETGPSGVNVNCIAPGVIMTDMLNNLNEKELNELKEQIPLNRLGTTEDIAHLALFLASDKAKYITGQIISPNGGMVI